MDEDRQGQAAAAPISIDAVGALVAFLDTNGFERRRHSVLRRLQAIHESKQFATLPEDLRERIREIVAGAERPSS